MTTKVKNIISCNLKPLNKKAETIFKKIIAGVKPDEVKRIGEKGSVFMQVVVEEYFTLQYGKVYTVGHYYTQNGDLMSDPRMTFLVNDDDGRVYPLSFEMHGVFARYEENCNFTDGNLSGIYRKMNNDHKNFANQWMENIDNQQNL